MIVCLCNLEVEAMTSQYPLHAFQTEYLNSDARLDKDFCNGMKDGNAGYVLYTTNSQTG